MKSMKTKKGTELPLLDMRGKAYLQVAHRLVWFREEHPTARIETIPHLINADIAIFRARIYTDEGMMWAEATKTETPKGFSDYTEKAETGAVGRALAMCGYGTQFAPDFDEGDDVCDAPVTLEDPRPKGYGITPKIAPVGPTSAKKVVL